MVQIIRQEWEIAKTYIFEVVLRDGLINLDWHDFENRAQRGKPSIAVKVDEPVGISELTDKAIGEVLENTGGILDSVMVVVSYTKGNDIMMDELGGMNESFLRLADENVDIVWGLQLADDIVNTRCVTVFAFEKNNA